MKKYLLIIMALSIATHFAFWGHPDQTVFDEVHFGKFSSSYYTGGYYFDIHPPLGKLIIAGFGKLFGFTAEGGSFANIGDRFPDSKYVTLRFLPSMAGALLPAIVFLLALQLGFSHRASFVAGILITLENGLLVQSRFILMDAFLILFGFLSLLFYFKQYKIPNTKYLILASVFAGLAMAIKWTGLTFLALILLLEAVKIIKFRDLGKIIPTTAKLIILPLVVYFSVFVVHFTLLPNPGPGDAFMKVDFQERSVVQKFKELNLEMYRANQRLTATHPYSSQWYSWPFMTRSIFYWTDTSSPPNPDGQSRIYFLGNPIVWWGSTIAMVVGLWFLAYGFWSGRKSFVISHSPLVILLCGYFLNLLPFVGIGRVMFLYHYLIAMIFAVLILVYLVDPERTDGRDDSRPTSHGTGKTKKRLLAGLVLASLVAFLYFAPLSYGLPLSEKAYNARIWFAGWR